MALMKPIQQQLKALFKQAFSKAFPAIPVEPKIVKANPKKADYSCSDCIPLHNQHGRSLGLARASDVAEKVAQALPQSDMLADVSVAPAGFISIKLKPAWVQSEVQAILASGDISCANTLKKRVVVDFSSPNIAKDMHVGHLRSTIMGEATCRMLEFSGHEVHRLNHVGDWGTQFGMLIEFMKEVYPDFQREQPNISDLQGFYKAAKKRFDEDPEFKEKSRLAVVDLQAGDDFARNAWQFVCDVSRKAFEKIYERLDINVHERGESFYNAMIPPLVKDLEDRGLIKESDGAKCFFTPDVFKHCPDAEYPLIAVKQDGGFGYDSTDLAAIYHRLFMMRADWVIYITDHRQQQHFEMIFNAAEQAGWHRPGVSRLDHMWFGVVLGEDGKPLKSRQGDTVKLKDLLDEAVKRALKTINSKVEEKGDKGKEVFLKKADERERAAESLGIAAVRYFDMHMKRTSDYVFDYDQVLDIRGNSAVYLCFAYARIRSIQRKSGIDIATIPASKLNIFAHHAEQELAKKLCEFPDVISEILNSLKLNLLTDYMWQLCNVLTSFLTQCQVLSAHEMQSRLLLCEAARIVLHKSFFLLGIEPLEQI